MQPVNSNAVCVDNKRRTALLLARMLLWAADEADAVMGDDIVVKHIGSAVHRLCDRWKICETELLAAGKESSA